MIILKLLTSGKYVSGAPQPNRISPTLTNCNERQLNAEAGSVSCYARFSRPRTFKNEKSDRNESTESKSSGSDGTVPVWFNG